MEILGIFIEFINKVLSFEVLSIPLYYYLMTFTAVEMVIYILHAIKD